MVFAVIKCSFSGTYFTELHDENPIVIITKINNILKLVFNK